MSRAKKKTTSFFSGLVVTLLLLVIAATVAANVIFSGDPAPKVAGYYLYLQEAADMEPDIPQKSLVIAKASTAISLTPGNKVLCTLADGTTALRVIYLINVNEDNSTSYFPGTAEEQGSEPAISRSNIFAVCTWWNQPLYQYVQFTTSVTGLMALLVAPCVILIIMLLIKIVRSNQDEEIEEVLDDDALPFKDPGPSEKPKKKKEPLYDPVKPAKTDEVLEKKKSSIQENFSAKPVNENSPYQKAVQERTMRFRTPQQEDLERSQQEQLAKQQKAAAQKPAGTEPPTRTAPAAKPTASADRPAPPPVPVMPRGGNSAAPAYSQPQKPVQAPPATQPVQPDTRSSEEIRSAARQKAEAQAAARPNASRTPNIDDILMASQLRENSKSSVPVFRNDSEIARTDSIDDLIAVLEKQKKNL